jgi:hypothetical protein
MLHNTQVGCLHVYNHPNDNNSTLPYCTIIVDLKVSTGL